MLYPLAVAVISALFAGTVLNQFATRGHAHQLIWTVALGMSAVASAAYVLALPPTASTTAFRTYYALGAVLMPAWLGLGSIFLVAARRFADWCAAGLLAASALAVSSVSNAGLDTRAFAGLNGGPGSGILTPGPWLPLTIILNTLGVVAVVGVAIYSAVRVVQRKGSGRLLLANVCIAVGDLIVGVAGSMARTGHPELFWITMLVGWIVIFAGFLLTQPRLATSAGSRLDTGLSSPQPSPLPAERTPVA
ncbi:MAG TPA: hypothetical protein VFS62_15590 [Chloroflexota bacterium]|nr:hypothetical protein [Chloroflexota bacterium]